MREVKLWIRKVFKRREGQGLLDTLVDVGLKLLEQIAKFVVDVVGVCIIAAKILEDTLDGEPFLWREE